MTRADGIEAADAAGLELSLELSAEQLQLLAYRVARLLADAHDDGFLDTDGAARYLSLTKSAVYHLVERRQLPHQRAGGRLLFDKCELRRWVEQQP